jgi:hypothetical protein
MQRFPPEKERVNKSLAWMWAVDLRQAAIVKGKGFKAFCKLLNPSYTVPSSSTLRKYIEVNYKSVKAELEKAIKGASVAVTTDMWTCVARHGYITVTGHYI